MTPTRKRKGEPSFNQKNRGNILNGRGLALSLPAGHLRSPGTSPPPAGGKSSCAKTVPPRRWPPEDQKALGRTIQMLRERHEQLTQAILAKRVKIDVRTLRKIEEGTGETSWGMVASLASALSVTLEYFAELHDAFVREELAGA